MPWMSWVAGEDGLWVTLRSNPWSNGSQARGGRRKYGVAHAVLFVFALRVAWSIISPSKIDCLPALGVLSSIRKHEQHGFDE